MKISSILCRKCQNDNANHTTEYCPTHICKNCGGSGHVSKVCPKKETTKKPNSPYTSPSPIRKSMNSKKQTTKKQKISKFPAFSSFFLKREGRRNQENQTRLRHVCRCLVTKTQKFAHKLPLSLSNSR